MNEARDTVGVSRLTSWDAAVYFALTVPLQKFASVHARVLIHFNIECYLTARQTYKIRPSAALAEWQSLMA